MIVATSIAEYATYRVGRPAESTLGFVPTMGALHDGHRSLIKIARSRADQVAVSIFVNPLQFGPSEDYARYPRPIEADLAACEAEGVDVVFVPTVNDLYPAGRQVSVSPGALGRVFEGAARPGHFDGVLTVVLKLFNIIRPDIAIFGRKDAQQLACIQRMVADLNVDVEIVGAPIIREPDGLAMSSRNVYLSPTERSLALSLSIALEKAASQSTVSAARAAAYETLYRADAEEAFDLDYAAIVQPRTFAEVADDYTGPALFVVAARVGGTRLIDNAALIFG
jgi:pantoate--beta-alanine ligase